MLRSRQSLRWQPKRTTTARQGKLGSILLSYQSVPDGTYHMKIATSFAVPAFFCVTIFAAGSGLSAQQTPAHPSQATSQPGTYWSDQKLLDTVNTVAMGPR